MVQRSGSRRANMFETLVLAYAIISSFGASQGISIEHCFYNQLSISKLEPGCDEGQKGTLMFHIDSISSFRTTLSSASNPPLMVVCQSNEPMQMRLNLPYIEAYTTPSNIVAHIKLLRYTPPDIKTWSDTGSYLRYTSETNVSYIRWVIFESLTHFSGIVRCESTLRSTRWSQLFITPSTLPTFFHLMNPLNLFVPEIATSKSTIVVPCIGANSSDADTQNLKLYRRSLYHSFYTNEMNQDCISSLCDTMDYTVFPGYGPLRDLMGQPPMGDECREYIKNATGSIQDCNQDVIVSCADALAAFPKVKENCDARNNFFKNQMSVSHLYVSHESFRDRETVHGVDDAVYNESLGFVVPNASWDYESEYLCLIDPKNLTEKGRIVQGFIPLDLRRELNVTLEIIGNELSCEIDQLPLRHILRKRQTQFWMLDCFSLADCELQFRPAKGLGQPTVESKRMENNSVVNVDADHASSIDSKLSFRLPLKFQNGLVGCTGVFITNGTAPFYARTFRYLFNGLDERPHLASLNYSSEVVMSAKLSGQMQEGEPISVICVTKTFALFATIRFVLRYQTDNDNEHKMETVPPGLQPGKVTAGDGRWTVMAVKTSLGAEEAERELIIFGSPQLKEITCEAPQIHRPDWIRTTINVDVPPRSVHSWKPAITLMNMTIKQTTTTTSSVLRHKGLTVAAGELSAAAIAGITLGVVGLIIIVIVVIYLLLQYRKNVQVIRKLTSEEEYEFCHGEKNSSATAEDGGVNINHIGFPSDLRLTLENLKIDRDAKLGEGEYGVCFRGELENRGGVAVKSVKPNSDLNIFKDFLREVKIMAYVGQHENIIQMFGVVVEDIRKGVCYAVVELCPHGDLLNILRKRAPSVAPSRNMSYVNVIREDEKLCDVPQLQTCHLITIALHIARGMEYLSSKMLIHGDLAARNVLIFPNLVAKISDFGMSRRLYGSSDYMKKSKQAVPWRWMALESLQYLQFSSKSDMWAYAITLWEVFTFGDVPFPGRIWNGEHMRDLEYGVRPIQPRHAPDEIFKFISECWATSPEDRPSFSDAVAFFENYAEHSYANFQGDMVAC